ncbi:hypothetical protein BSL78_21452 [Apostichopus japonicus]|uniref:Nucleotide exchange factor Fes1 domain-containing protein n=1 Tax=Stichopus japonicus TaxID=307972 RepID=A0A2G8K125_STIJA|nr:hypothetical protein BSL78_21452 [Apostichopus japonicus]
MAMLPVEGGSNSRDQSVPGGNEAQARERLLPRNYEDILKFAVENTNPEEASHEPMSEERKEWLNQALAGMFTDEVKILKGKLEELSDILKSNREEDEERKENLLEYIVDLCDRIDNAKDLIKLDGWKVISHCLDDKSAEVRWRALEVAGTILQNNIYVQDCLLKEGAMKKFMKMADEDDSDLVKVKAIFVRLRNHDSKFNTHTVSISSLKRDTNYTVYRSRRNQLGHIREHNASEIAFVKADGFSCLMRAMQSNNQKIQIKSTFLLKVSLSNQSSKQIGMVQQLTGLLNTEHNPAHEHIAAALLCLVTEHPAAIADCRLPRLNLKKLLENRMTLIKDKEEFQEENQYCQDLLTMVFTSSNHDNKSSADR